MPTNKFKNTVVAITTGLLAASMSACTFGNKTASTSSPEASTVPGTAETPSESASSEDSTVLDTTETPSESTASSEGSTVPGITEASSESPTPSTPKNSEAVDPFAKKKNSSSAAWGTWWINGTGCTWQSTGSSSTTKNTSSKSEKSEDSTSSNPVVDKLTLLRNNVEKATTALANAVAARDNAAATVESAKAA